MKKGKLWLIPTPLGSGLVKNSLTAESLALIQNLTAFIVENEKTARKFLREAAIKVPQSELVIEEFGKHTQKPLREYFILLEQGQDIGLLSDAGCPGVADPGAVIVLEAHKRNIQVIPLIGPSSILLSLMASGLNGQSFVFHGYLPIEKKARRERLKQLENQAEKVDQTQIFIETPYRNNSLIQDMLECLKPETLVCLAAGITTESEFILTQSISLWKQRILVSAKVFDKTPTIFLVYKKP